MGLFAPALLVYGYHPLDPASDAWAEFVALWNALGITGPVVNLDAPATLPGMSPETRETSELLAVASAGELPEVWQLVARIEHDTVCLAAMMAPARELDCSGEWKALERRWLSAASPYSSTLFGEVRIFLALTGDEADADGVETEVRTAIPEPWAVRWHTRHDDVTLPGTEHDTLRVWEAGPLTSDGRPVRRLAAVGAARHEGTIDSLVWSSGDAKLAPLGRHLMHAAKVRDSVRRFADGHVTRKARRRLDEGVQRALFSVSEGGLREDVDIVEMLLSRLTRLQSAAGITAGNLRQALGGRVTGTGPLTDDVALADWFTQRLADEQHSLAEALADARRIAARPSSSVLKGRWAVVLTATEADYSAFSEHLTGEVVECEVRGTVYELGELPGAQGPWRVALAQVARSSSAAGVQLERAVDRFCPEVVMFLCPASGRLGVQVGDVVAAASVYDYESGVDDVPGFRPTIKTHHASHRLVQRAQFVARKHLWQKRLQGTRQPSAVVGPLAAGSKVIVHPSSTVARLLEAAASDAHAVTRGSYGFLHAAYVNDKVDALVVVGVSRLLTDADPPDATDASTNAAAFAIELLGTLPVKQSAAR
ncbi:CATRA conflict system CASPASE/TPR repeat-associated protein [Actinocrispum wychmicini]|uniref:CATRA conflict system CASPASE/TPR repeat-associated protein n=1 Tax=Actinocrispum wychmicini TaxID=1213861 RepID=UPI00104D7E7A|nr:CATRA conflict system CASPASE/TPR repeat-associated protein [Actinocrispum wychmicini]